MRTTDDLRKALRSCEQEPPELQRFLDRIPALTGGASPRHVVGDIDALLDMVTAARDGSTSNVAVSGDDVGRSKAASWFALRRRRAIFAISALLLACAGMGVAAAAGVSVVPQTLVAFFEGDKTPGAFNPDARSARLLFSLRGPTGHPLELWYADASDNGFCAYLFGTHAPRPAPASGPSTVPVPLLPADGAGSARASQVDVLVGGCSGVVGDAYWDKFAGAAFGAGLSPGCQRCADNVASFIVHVPNADRVRLDFADGTSQPLPLADGWTAGWVTRDEAARTPMLVGYAGSVVVGRFPIRS